MGVGWVRRSEEAVQALRAAIEAGDEEAYALLGEVLCEMGHYDESEVIFEEGVGEGRHGRLHRVRRSAGPARGP